MRPLQQRPRLITNGCLHGRLNGCPWIHGCLSSGLHGSLSCLHGCLHGSLNDSLNGCLHWRLNGCLNVLLLASQVQMKSKVVGRAMDPATPAEAAWPTAVCAIRVVAEDALDAAAAAAETDGGTEADVVPDTTTAPSVQDDDGKCPRSIHRHREQCLTSRGAFEWTELPSEQVHAEANGALANGASANGEGLSSATTPPPKGWVLLRESRARGLWV
jgi:hypothetical protein